MRASRDTWLTCFDIDIYINMWYIYNINIHARTHTIHLLDGDWSHEEYSSDIIEEGGENSTEDTEEGDERPDLPPRQTISLRNINLITYISSTTT